MRITRTLTLGLLAASALAVSGCAQTDSIFKSTKDFYHSHINRPTTLDVEERTVLAENESNLVQRVMLIDEELSKLEKALDALATPPDAEGASNILRRFPWLSGLAMVAPDGTLGASIPPVPLKQLDYSPLLELAPKALARDLRASVQDTPFGPEILIARPFIVEDELQLLLVASFDFRALLPFAASPSDLIVRSADVLVWSGELDYEATPLAKIDWADYLKGRTHGELSNKDMEMLWVTRYIGGRPLVFASLAH